MKWGRGKIYDRAVTKIIYDKLKEIKIGKVEDISFETLTNPRPVGLNTVKMLKVGSKTFGMGAHDTLRIAEHLYLSGYITYPRTESTTFSNNFNFKEIL